MHVTIKLLENAMCAELKKRTTRQGWADGQGRFLIDGFPRKMDQALKFEEDVCFVFHISTPCILIATQVCVSSLTLFFTTTEDVMLNRLLERGKTSGREDDNVESIKKRFRTYKNDTMPVIEYHATLNKVVEVRILTISFWEFTESWFQIDSSPSVDEVYKVTNEIISKLLKSKAEALAKS